MIFLRGIKVFPCDKQKYVFCSFKHFLIYTSLTLLLKFKIISVNRQLDVSTPSLKTYLPVPYHPVLTKPIKKILASHDIKVTDSRGTNLQDLPNTTTTPGLLHTSPQRLLRGSYQRPADYDRQTYRRVHKHISEHESDFSNGSLPGWFCYHQVSSRSPL